MLHGLPQDGEFVEFASEGLTGGDHGSQLVDEVVHLIPPPLLDLPVRLPAGAVTNQTDISAYRSFFFVSGRGRVIIWEFIRQFFKNDYSWCSFKLSHISR